MSAQASQVLVPADVIQRLKNVSSGSLTTELFKKGLRQCFLVGLKPMNPKAVRFAGEAFTLRMIPAREDAADILAEGPPGRQPLRRRRQQPRAGSRIYRERDEQVECRRRPAPP
jgi:hypothetical protein